MIAFGSSDMTKAYVGSTEVKKICLGSEQVCPVESALPYDAEVEYLESTGTQYIETNFHLSSLNYKMESKWQQLEATSEIKYYVGQCMQYSNYRIGFYSNARNKYAATYGNRYTASSTSTDTSVHVLVFNKNILYRDGTRIVSTNRSTSYIENSDIVRLFTTNIGIDSIDITPPIKARLFYFKLWENDNLYLDLIPVRKGNVGYLYDKVSGELFGNAGTGSFILGNDAN